MSAPAEVRPARGGESQTVASVLTDAFAEEAGLNYWLRQGDARTAVRRRFFRAAVGDMIHKDRELWLADTGGTPAGAAIWLKPGDHAFAFTPLKQLLTTPLFISIAGFEGMKRARELGGALNSHHPKQRHAHLVFLGVAPSAQGRGVGSAMLKQTLAPLDERGVTAYLECTTERNAALYKRHGFEVTGEFDFPGLHFWTMTRAPRSA